MYKVVPPGNSSLSINGQKVAPSRASAEIYKIETYSRAGTLLERIRSDGTVEKIPETEIEKERQAAAAKLKSIPDQIAAADAAVRRIQDKIKARRDAAATDVERFGELKPGEQKEAARLMRKVRDGEDLTNKEAKEAEKFNLDELNQAMHRALDGKETGAPPESPLGSAENDTPRAAGEPSPKIKAYLEARAKHLEEIRHSLARERFPSPAAERELAELDAKVDDPAFGAPLMTCRLAPDDKGGPNEWRYRASVGKVGVVPAAIQETVQGFKPRPANFRVSQILDARNMLVRQLGNLNRADGAPVWITGIDTSRFAGNIARGKIMLPQVFEVTGTKRYETVLGGSQTVFVLEPFDVDGVRPFLKFGELSEHEKDEAATLIKRAKSGEKLEDQELKRLKELDFNETADVVDKQTEKNGGEAAAKFGLDFAAKADKQRFWELSEHEQEEAAILIKRAKSGAELTDQELKRLKQFHFNETAGIVEAEYRKKGHEEAKREGLDLD
ncbi:MAG TPA: hypothetical protein VMV69_30410 [Pirellulales bacterium]|nr:hypothetical protein [Pirellulales bacterium]